MEDKWRNDFVISINRDSLQFVLELINIPLHVSGHMITHSTARFSYVISLPLFLYSASKSYQKTFQKAALFNMENRKKQLSRDHFNKQDELEVKIVLLLLIGMQGLSDSTSFFSFSEAKLKKNIWCRNVRLQVCRNLCWAPTQTLWQHMETFNSFSRSPYLQLWMLRCAISRRLSWQHH